MATEFDSDKAYSRNRRMWVRLGGLFERAAYKAAEDPFQRTIAAELGALAECCFWQATGESDSFDIRRDFIRKRDAAA